MDRISQIVEFCELKILRFYRDLSNNIKYIRICRMVEDTKGAQSEQAVPIMCSF
jgi:hypothetical protein